MVEAFEGSSVTSASFSAVQNNMRRWRFSFCLLIVSGLLAVSSITAQEKPDDARTLNETAHLVGNWSGESVCVNKEKFPACHDEQVIYRIVKSADKSNVVAVTMDKIVNGKPETMAVFDFVYDAQKQTLSSEFTRNSWRGLWQLVVNGDLMEGNLTTLPEKITVRRIKVQKDKSE